LPSSRSLVTPVAATADAGPTFLRSLGGPNHAQIYPSGFDFAPDGTIVVADTGNDQVEKFSVTPNSYTELWRVGSTGTGIGQFSDPRDIGIDHLGNIFVADARNSRIVKLDPNGEWITSFVGSPGNTVSFPLGLSVHQTAGGEFLFVADSAHNKIRVFDLNGTLLKTFVSNGVCTFSGPRDVDADPAGNVYIQCADTNQTFPNAPITFNGTAADNVGVAFVRIAIKNRTTGLWWHAGGTWGTYQLQVCSLGNPGSMSTTWSYVWTPPGPGQYSVLAESQDAAGNRAVPKPTIRFIVNQIHREHLRHRLSDQRCVLRGPPLAETSQRARRIEMPNSFGLTRQDAEDR
jgi:hypothetical protein